MHRLLSIVSHRFLLFPTATAAKGSQVITSATCSTICLAQVKEAEKDIIDQSTDAIEVLRKWGCSDDDLAKIFSRRQSLRNADLAQLQSRLSLLSRLGIQAPDLVKIINCRPRFLSSRINCFDQRLEYLLSLFKSRERLNKAIVRNPSILTSDYQDTIKHVLTLYQDLGVKKEDFIFMLCSRPTIISRTSFDDEKLEYIRKTGVSKDSKMYKYVATILGVSRLQTIRDKIANFARFGFSDDEIFGLIGRSPLILTLSIDKVQRNMTFILGTIKLEAKTVLKNPYLLYANLDTVLKPRVLLARKIQDMDRKLKFTEPTTLMALRMTEKRFVKVVIECHHKEVANELMEFYTRAKEVKRLAGSSKKCTHNGLPF